MPTDEKNRRNVVERLLNDQSYHIEFNVFLTNHVKHAVIALNGLGASPQRIEDYYDSYASCTAYGYGLEPQRLSEQTITQDNWQAYFGKHCSFTSYCQFFDQQEKQLGMHRLLGEYLPSLLPGCVGSLMHGTIHLGWALDSGNRWMIIEGLAYMAFSYVSCQPEKTFPADPNPLADKSALDSLIRIAETWETDREALCAWLETTLKADKYSEAAGFHPELSVTGTQYQIAKVLAEGHPLIHATPAWIESQDMATIWKQLYDALTLLYMTEPGDFIVLHLITSLYAMEQIAKQLPVDEQKRAIKCYWTAMLGVLFSRGEMPSKARLAALHAKYKDALDGDGSVREGQDWEQIISQAINEEEEHNPKLVYVQNLMWKRFGRRSVFRVAAGHFTTTPKIPKLETGAIVGADRPC
ncbi:MAG: questin oxidase family protein [Nitrospiraceae bacterium]